ncbi:cytochrome P450 [Streptomyces olivaceoviridis]|uniref:Cytochrome P450 n=1 Tax=Streptomyces olivaceoviridis TaxID=1921 RepID=A0ABW7V1Q9_STROI|nr:cytochrome P450 [Streptomyces corchorusii]
MARVIDLTEYGDALRRDPHPVYARLRERGPVHRVRLATPGGAWETWLVVGYEEARAALADQRLAKDIARTGFVPLDEQLIGKYLLVADPPQHTRLRGLVARAFTMRRVERLRPRIRQITDELLDDMLPRGHADLVDSLAYPLPITVICELLGVPEMDRAEFRKTSTEVVAPTGTDSERAATVRLAEYLTELIEDKRCAGPTGDLLSDLIRTTAEDGDRLSMDELRGMAYLLLIAGHETTVNLIGNAVLALLTHPDQLAALRADPSLLDKAVEETLRWEGPVETATYRFAAEPLEIAGTRIGRGDDVLVGLTAAQRDGARFTDPDRFDIRRDTRGHLAFGHGIHYCLGAPLARLEAGVALGALLDRAPGLTLDGEPGEWLPGMLMRGVRSLPVRW